MVDEGLQQFDLFLSKRVDGRATEEQHADRLLATQHGHAKQRPITGGLLHVRISIFRICQYVGNLDGCVGQQGPSDDAASSGLQAVDVGESDPVDCKIVIGRVIKTAFVLAGYRSHVSIAQARRGLSERVQYCLQVERRAADDLENICSRGLLLQGLRQIVGAFP